MIVLRAGAGSASIVPEVGGRLGQLDLGDGPLLRGPDPDLGWAHWGCYPLVPWSNRIPGGRLRFGAIDALLPVNWPDGTAIHGLAASCPWTVVEAGEQHARLEVELAGGPYRMRAEQSFALEPGRLRLRLRATNQGDAAVPVGIGIHPWFRYGRVQLAADERWPGEPLPTGPPVPVDGIHDLRGGVEPALMDTCFTGLTSTTAEVPGARLSWTGPVTNVVVYTGEPGWVCVEPVTMASNGIELARQGAASHGIEVLEPGRSIEVAYAFESVARSDPPAA